MFRQLAQKLAAYFTPAPSVAAKAVPELVYLRDTEQRLCRGPSHEDENMHWSRLEGFTNDNVAIWVLRRTDPPEVAVPCYAIAEALFAEFQAAAASRQCCRAATQAAMEQAIATAKDCAMYYGRGSEQFPGCQACVCSLEGRLARFLKQKDNT